MGQNLVKTIPRPFRRVEFAALNRYTLTQGAVHPCAA